MDIATIVGLVTAMTLTLMTADFDMTVFGDHKSYLTVVGSSIGLMLISLPLSDINRLPRYIMYAFKPPKADAEREKVINELEKGILMLSRAKTYVQATGWIGVLIGAVLMLIHMDDPDAFQPAAALCLLTALYGIIIAYILCLPLATKLQVRLDEWKRT